MMSERSKVQNPETLRKWALARRIGGATLATTLAGVGMGAAHAYNETLTKGAMQVSIPTLEIDLSDSDPLIASLIGPGVKSTGYGAQIDNTSMATEIPAMAEQPGDSLLPHSNFITGISNGQ